MVVGGEAGIGKTALVASVCEAVGSRRVLWGACDPLVTPRTLGPLRDVARDAGGALSDALEADGSRESLLAAVLDELTRSRSDPRRGGRALGRRRDARPRRAPGAPPRALPWLPRDDVPDRGAHRAPRGPQGPRRHPAGGPAADRAGAAVRDGGRDARPPDRAARARPAPGVGRQPLLRHRGARGPVRRGPGHDPRRGGRARRRARPGGARRHRDRRRGAGSDRAAPAGGHGRREPGRHRRLCACRDPPGA